MQRCHSHLDRRAGGSRVQVPVNADAPRSGVQRHRGRVEFLPGTPRASQETRPDAQLPALAERRPRRAAAQPRGSAAGRQRHHDGHDGCPDFQAPTEEFILGWQSAELRLYAAGVRELAGELESAGGGQGVGGLRHAACTGERDSDAGVAGKSVVWGSDSADHDQAAVGRRAAYPHRAFCFLLYFLLMPIFFTWLILNNHHSRNFTTTRQRVWTCSGTSSRARSATPATPSSCTS